MTERRSSSLPTQEKTKSLPSAASRRRRGERAAMLGDPFLGLGGGAVVDGDVVAALVLQVAGHRIAHDAKPRNATFAIFVESFQSDCPVVLKRIMRDGLESALEVNA